MILSTNRAAIDLIHNKQIKLLDTICDLEGQLTGNDPDPDEFDPDALVHRIALLRWKRDSLVYSLNLLRDDANKPCFAG